MLRAFIRKSVADLRSEWSAGAVIFIILTIAAGSLVMSLQLSRGAELLWDRAVATSNGPDLILGSHSPQADFSPLATIDAVAATETVQTSGPLRVAGARQGLGTAELAVSLVAAEPLPVIGRPRIVEGQFAASSTEIVLDHSLAREAELEVGDSVRLIESAVRSPIEFSVVGTAVNVVNCPATGCEPQLGYVTVAGFDRLDPGGFRNNLALIQFSGPVEAAEVIASAERVLAPGTIDEINAATATREEVLQESAVSGLGQAGFTVVAMIVVGVALLNMASVRVLLKRSELSLLKAGGLTPRQTALYLVIQAGLTAVAAYGVGVVLGMAGAGFVLRDLLRDLAAGPVPPLDLPRLAVGLGLFVAFIMLFVLVPSVRASRRSPIRGVARDEPAGGVAGRWKRLPVPFRLGLRQVWYRRPRALLALATLALGFATVILALGAIRTIHHVTVNPGVTGDPFDVFVNESSFGLPEAEKVFADDDRIAAIFTRGSFLGRVNGSQRFVTTRTLGGDYRNAGYSVPDGRMIEGLSEAVAGYGFLNEFGLAVGDRIKLNTGLETIDLIIVGQHGETDDKGVVVMFDEATLQRPPPSSVLIKLADRNELDGVIADLAVADPAITIEAEEPGPGTVIRSLQTTSIIMGSTLVVLALINLFGSALLTVREHRRDFGVAKAVGFTPRDVLLAVTSGNAALAATAAVVGIVIGMLATRVMLSFVGIELGTGPDFGRLPDWWQLVVVALGATVLSVLTTWLAGRRAAVVEPGEVLRFE